MINNTNQVVFKGRKEGIIILLDDKIDFDELREVFTEKVTDARKFFGGGKTSITFQGRTLTDEQESELLQIIANEANVNISFFQNREGTKPSANSDAPSGLPPEASSVLRAVNASKPNSYQQNTVFNTGSLRSGQAINYPGTVVVMGDINPGAEVTAGGNIIVIGAAKGFLHAGSSGDSSCFVFATELSPVQLRIAETITVIPKNDESTKRFFLTRKKIATPAPSLAYVLNGQIYIAQV